MGSDHRVMRRSPTSSVVLVLLLGVALGMIPVLGCGADPEDEGESLRRKHVLVTLIDACATDHLSLYGYDRETMPFLSQLAQDGIVFEDVTAPAPYTIASVASLMTGEAVDVHGVEGA